MAQSIPSLPETGRPTAVSGAPRRFRATGGVPKAAGVVAVTALVLFGLVAPAAAQDYEVQPGDSLSVIARDNGVSTAELAAANGISDLHLIRVGQVLRIPRPEPVYYEVKAGDSLSVIAQRAGVSMAALVELNGITNPGLIRIGQKLELPVGAAVAPVDPAAGYDSLPGRLRAAPERLELIPSFEQWSAHYGVPTDLLMAMAYRESGWQTDVVSHKGAMGVGQLLPTTAEWVANDLIKADLDPNDPDDNIRMSARLLQWLFGYMGGEQAAIAAYYQGPGSVNARGYYDDTQEYIDNVASIRHMFRQS
ncbi:MAG: LysM peptidoglycan-binding domain-containing protein [Actinomycetota bacterium]